MHKRNTRYWIFNILKYICILYALIGLILWAISFIHTDYKNIHIADWAIGDDGAVGYQWNLHDNSWELFDMYTYPFAILSLPLYYFIIEEVSEGKLTFIQHDVLILYFIFTPILLLWLSCLLKKAISNGFRFK